MDQQLLDKFFNGQCSAEEHKAVMAWYLSGQADQELSEKIEKYWNDNLPEQKGNWGKEVLFQDIVRQIDEGIKPGRKTIPIGQPHKRLWKVWGNVAAAVLLLALSWWYFSPLYQNNTSSEQSLSSKPTDVFATKKTTKGEKLTLILADGSVVKLNADSRIRYREGLDTLAEREVFLEGEAYFEVARDPSHPFIIQTVDVTTTVLGTSFNVSAYSNSETTEVSVVSGRVTVQAEKASNISSILLFPQEQAYYSSQDTVLTKRKFNYQQVVGWKDGTLYFGDASFPEIIQELERWYGVEFDVRKQNIEDGFSGTYTNKSLESVLDGISFVLKFDYEIQDKKVIIQ